MKAMKSTPKEGKRYTFTVTVSDLLSNSRRYKNSTFRRFGIDEKYSNVIAIVAEYAKMDMAQLVNNMISTFLDNEEYVQELKRYCAEYQKKQLKRLINERDMGVKKSARVPKTRSRVISERDRKAQLRLINERLIKEQKSIQKARQNELLNKLNV